MEKVTIEYEYRNKKFVTSDKGTCYKDEYGNIFHFPIPCYVERGNFIDNWIICHEECDYNKVDEIIKELSCAVDDKGEKLYRCVNRIKF